MQKTEKSIQEKISEINERKHSVKVSTTSLFTICMGFFVKSTKCLCFLLI